MNKKGVAIIVTLAALAISACNSTVDDMLNNKFTSVIATQAPPGLVGVWTGSMGPYLTTMKWFDDGNGIFCYSFGQNDVLQKMKFSGGDLYLQDGAMLRLTSTSRDKISITNIYDNKNHEFHSDQKLSSSSIYCSDKLKAKT
jgi:hypothetical protein